MGERAIIRQGDMTSHGGIVIEGHPFLIIHGKPAAGVGHKVQCPKCPGNVVIIEGAMNATMMGINIAVEGMKTSCGAILIASQITDTIEYGSGATPPLSANQHYSTSAVAPIGNFVTGAHNSTAASTAVDKSIQPYDEQVRVIDDEGQPITGMPYHITDESGNVYKGFTDSDGCCERVHTANPESLAILTGASALEKWQ